MTNTDYKSMPKQRGCKTEIRVISGSRMWGYYTPESSDRIASLVSHALPIVAQDKEGNFAYINTSEAPAIVVRVL